MLSSTKELLSEESNEKKSEDKFFSSADPSALFAFNEAHCRLKQKEFMPRNDCFLGESELANERNNKDEAEKTSFLDAIVGGNAFGTINMCVASSNIIQHQVGRPDINFKWLGDKPKSNLKNVFEFRVSAGSILCPEK